MRKIVEDRGKTMLAMCQALCVIILLHASGRYRNEYPILEIRLREVECSM